jgi:pimeloyl-ACP methyl ester carboxylesterase
MRMEITMARSNTFRRLRTLVVALTLLVAATSTDATQQTNQNRGVSNIVLVHGAWADGSSWSKVIPLLAARGLRVVAVQLSLTSQANDVATVQRAIALVDGPLLLVAHSYGGAVITQAGNDPKVAGLVYVAAFAPAEGESPFDLTVNNPPPFLQHLEQDAFGFLKLTSIGIREDFAPDLSDSEQTVLAATQGPTSGAALGGAISTPAWRNKPSWFVIADHDRVVLPTLQAMFAERMNATSITLSSSHVAMLSHPHAVASFIRRAARDAW